MFYSLPYFMRICIARCLLAFLVVYTGQSRAAGTYEVLENFGAEYSVFPLVQDGSGNFYGVSLGGFGAIFKLAPNGSGGFNKTKLHEFDGSHGANPAGGLVFGTDGMLYGVTQGYGCSSESAVAYKIDIDGSGYQVLHGFGNGCDSPNSYGELITASGKVYGILAANGAGSQAIFRMDQDGGNYAIIHQFIDELGCRSLTSGDNNKLYGVCENSGFYGKVFSLMTDGSSYQIIHAFSGASSSAGGIYPRKILWNGGALYGATSQGGNENGGTIFKMTPDGLSYTVLHHHNASVNGNLSDSGMIDGNDGWLYATSHSNSVNSGSVFKVAKDGSGTGVLFEFDASHAGRTPQALTLGNDGKLYGITQGESYSVASNLFRVSKNGSAYGVLYSFPFTNPPSLSDQGGNIPPFELTLAMDGSLYGVSNQGGSETAGGIVFRLTPNAGGGYTRTVVYSFDAGSNPASGMHPLGGLAIAPDGKIYGSTAGGGNHDKGTVFRLTPNGSGGFSHSVLHHFSGSYDGALPYGQIVFGADGNLYGTTHWGGNFFDSDQNPQPNIPCGPVTRGCGTIFMISPDGSGYGVLHYFDENTSGRNPRVGLMKGGDGSLFGATDRGVFKLTFSNGSYSDNPEYLVDFRGSNSTTPSSLTIAADGTVYGVSEYGGQYQYGTLFKLTPDSSGNFIYDLLHEFNPTVGSQPRSKPILGSDGNLYGAASNEGIGGYGMLYRISTSGNEFTVLHDFNYTQGAYPVGLTLAANGSLVGVTQAGGSAGGGTLFRLSGLGLKNSTILSLSASNAAPSLGEYVNLTAVISNASNPSGQVIFKDGTSVLGSSPITNGVANFPTNSLSEGEHSILAVFEGDASNASSTSSTVLITVGPDARYQATAVLTYSPSVPVVGGTLKLIATVIGSGISGKAPTGLVTFKDVGTTLGTGTLNASRQATLSTSSLAGGVHNLTAEYAGDSNNQPAISLAATVTVNPITSKTTLSISSTHPSMGSPLTLTARVFGSSVTGYKPTGTVTFKDGNSTLGSASLNSSLVATFSTTTLGIGPHALTATYSGDLNNRTSDSPVVNVDVVETISTTTLSRSNWVPGLGAQVIFLATVTGNTAEGSQPSGTVTFLDGDLPLATVALSVNASDGKRQAQLITNGLNLGSHFIRAVYEGDSHNLNSTSASLAVNVLKSQSFTYLGVSTRLPLAGSPVTLSVMLNGNTSTDRAPTGTVRFLDGATVIGTAVLDGSRKASIVNSNLTKGIHTVTAVYDGDGNNYSSTSAAVVIRVR